MGRSPFFDPFSWVWVSLPAAPPPPPHEWGGALFSTHSHGFGSAPPAAPPPPPHEWGGALLTGLLGVWLSLRPCACGRFACALPCGAALRGRGRRNTSPRRQGPSTSSGASA